MSMWTDGYVAEIEYTHGFYKELTPNLQELACFVAELKTRELGGSDSNYLELGFGQGLSFNIHAATNPGTFWGTDFNPSQVLNAQELAQASGADVIALDASFQQLAQRDDLPEFDVIALHGIWSWISDENRSFIVDIARRKLKPDGIFYISYNVMPGWSPAMPLRHLMSEYVERLAKGDIKSKIDAALDFSQSVVDVNSGYFAANPAVAQRLKKLKTQGQDYLAHEYFNADWHPMPFSKAASILAEAKLEFGVSSNLLDNIDAINLNEAARKLLATISDPVMYQTVRDYFVNQQFRKDIFVKGAKRLTQFEINKIRKEKSFILLSSPSDVPSKIKGSFGEADLDAIVYNAVIGYLASDNYAPKCFNEICSAKDCEKLTGDQVWKSVQVLCGMGMCAPAQDHKIAKQVSKTALGLNRELWRRAEFSNSITSIAAPLIGSGITATRCEQLFLSAMDKNLKEPVQYVAELLKSQGQQILIDDKPIETDAEQLSEIQTLYETFKEKRLPIMKRLMII